MDYEKEIPFGAFDSELMRQEISIPEGFEATIEGNKIILKKIESEDKTVINNIKKVITWYKSLLTEKSLTTEQYDEIFVWLEKQGEQKLPIEKLPEEMKTIGESLGFTTQKECDEYNKMVSDLIMSDGNETKPNFEVGDTIRLKNSTAEYTIESISDGCYHGKGWSLNIIDADKSGDYVLVEHKYTLSDEEEKARRALIEMVHDTTGDSLWIDYDVHKEEAIARLEKQCEKPQRMISAEAKEAMYDKPACVWSEEDENVLEDIEEAIINYWHGDTQDILLDWLKSIKQRIKGE